jgi:hypothetical protein
MDSPQRVVLDIDSTEIPVYGSQERSANNGHFESTCYHPLLLFNREGDCLAARLQLAAAAGEDGRLVKHAWYYGLLLAEGHPMRRVFGAILRRFWALPLPVG